MNRRAFDEKFTIAPDLFLRRGDQRSYPVPVAIYHEEGNVYRAKEPSGAGSDLLRPCLGDGKKQDLRCLYLLKR